MDSQLIALFGPSTAKTLLAAVKNSQQTQGVVATAISVVTLMIGATIVLAALGAVLDQIWNSGTRAPSGLRGWVRTRFLIEAGTVEIGKVAPQTDSRDTP